MSYSLAISLPDMDNRQLIAFFVLCPVVCIETVSRSRIRSVLAEVTFEQITKFRLQVEEKIKKELNSFFLPKGLIAEGALLSEIKLLGAPGTEEGVLLSEVKSLKPGKAKKEVAVYEDEK